MFEIIRVKQGSPEWLELRTKHYKTASRTPAIMGLSPFATAEDVGKEVKFDIKPFYNNAMKRGNQLEEYARELAKKKLDDIFMPKVGLNGEFLASLDGINFDWDTIIEIKVSEHTYKDVKAGNIPDHYMAQIQHQLMVFNVDKAYLVAYSPQNENIAVSEPIKSDPIFQEQIKEAWTNFDKFLAKYELPKVKEIEDKKLKDIATELGFVEKMMKEMQERANNLKAELLEGTKSEFEESEKLKIGNLVLSKRNGTKKVDYKSFIEDNGLKIDEKYFSVGTPSVTFKFNG